MKLVGIYLTDAATTREGLAQVLGLGITTLNRPSFPSPAGVSALLLVDFDSGETRQDVKFKIDVADVSQENSPILEADGDLHYDGTEDLEVGATTPIVLNLNFLELPSAGLYTLRARAGGQEVERTFRAKVVEG